MRSLQDSYFLRADAETCNLPLKKMQSKRGLRVTGNDHYTGVKK